MMRRAHRVSPLLLVVCGLLAATSVRAQLGIALASSHDKFLRYEPIEVTVTLRNYSGNTLTFSQDGPNRGYLFFEVDTHNGRLVKPLKTKENPAEGLVLNAGETKALSLSLNNFFDLQKPGSYTVKAQIGHARLGNDYQSDEVTFEVREGLPILSRNVGLPGEDGGTRIKAMKVSLVLFQDDDQAIYCLRVEDDDLVYATIRLGRQIDSSEPEMDADATSDVHLLLQVAARLYSYQIYNMAGGRVKLRQQSYYSPDNAVPRLTRSPGYIKVVNGKLAVEGVDYIIDTNGQYRSKTE